MSPNPNSLKQQQLVNAVSSFCLEIHDGIGVNGFVGEAGNDTLTGGFGENILLGGAGRDVLNADADDDLLARSDPFTRALTPPITP